MKQFLGYIVGGIAAALFICTLIHLTNEWTKCKFKKDYYSSKSYFYAGEC